MRHRFIRLERQRHYPFSAKEAWRLLADTDNINRNIGLPSVDFSPPGPAETGFVRKARAKAFSVIPVRWTEYAFDWVRERRYAVRREFESGPVAMVEGGVELEPTEEGVLVKVFAEFTPANLAGRLLVALRGRRSVEDVLACCDRYLSRRAEGKADPIPVPRAPTVDRAEVDRLIGRLRELPVRQDLVGGLRDRILEGTDAQLLRVRPYALADAWGADRFEVLRLFLHATRVGLFNLRWELMCPTCRVPKGEAPTLANLPERFHCETCGIDYATEFDRRVELRFSVHPGVRRAEDRIYCVGGPFRTPHIVAQQNLRPHESRSLEPAVTGPLQLRAVGRIPRVRLLPSERQGCREIRVTYALEGWVNPGSGAGPLEEIPFMPGEISLHLQNETDAPVVTVLEETEGAGEAATAAEVTTLQEFRDLFSSEVLAPGQEVGVQNIALLFSDLKGSTSMYEGVGDAAAYRRVNRHFDLLRETISEHRGTIVKTIGDAVMGAFASIDDALAAALTVQAELSGWCEREGIDPPLVLRIGLHQGPVIAVNANHRLDYFGRTVNTAARVELESEGGDIVLLKDVFGSERAQALLDGFHVQLQDFTATLRGIEGKRELVRLRVGAGAHLP